MNPLKISLLALAMAWMVQLVSAQPGQPDPNNHIYLLFGQSNMAGGGAISDSPAVDCDTTPRVKVLAFSDCSAGPNCKSYVMKRTVDQWYTAFPPLHDCSAGLEGICPGDWFGKTMIDSVRSDISIGLVPCALSGMALNVFLKGSSATSTVGPPAVRGKNAYAWMLARCKLAQQKGVIKGMLLHQGESGSGSSQAWDAMAMQIFNDLKTDLGLDSKTVLVVGQLRSDSKSPSQNNTSFNTMIAGMPAKYPKVGMASSEGLSGNGKDVWHFNPSSMRDIGRRYAKALLSLSDNTFIPRKGEVVGIGAKAQKAVSQNAIVPAPGDMRIYSLDGKQVSGASGASGEKNAAKEGNSGDGFLIRASNGKSLQILPE